jgi:hypothetical protein
MSLLCLCMAIASVLVPQTFLDELRKSDEPQLELRSAASDISQTGSASTRLLSKLLIAVIAIFLFLHVSVEIAYCKENVLYSRVFSPNLLFLAGWLSVYAQQRKLANKYEQFYLNSLFWGTIALFRVAGLPVVCSSFLYLLLSCLTFRQTTRLKPITLLFVTLCGCLVSNLFMLIWNKVTLLFLHLSLCFYLSLSLICLLSHLLSCGSVRSSSARVCQRFSLARYRFRSHSTLRSVDIEGRGT